MDMRPKNDETKQIFPFTFCFTISFAAAYKDDPVSTDRPKRDVIELANAENA